ncbi:zinc finger Y-chromosomal protein-like isoform X7 [Mizuhopecten yessoensis]|uniref:zinc finger Y-chromosomal protein-like isoform X7 n=1 Tax=Mizuhopecten yessoensis TaxID=6573 RepID=UPI000B45799D|nr:zinc finger Y-chromosomal protein-like isoform X7 [Mizuhopecten yessoensis]
MKMRPSGEQVQESTFCDILHNAVLQVCREKYWADSPDWEVDGVICISVPHSQEQHVVKIHQKFPSNSSKHFDDRCYECDRKSKDVPLPANEETTKRHFSESVEEDDSSYRNVSVIDLEHASTQPNPARTCGQGTIPQSLPSPEREHDQNSHNFYASPDLSGFGPNVHRQKDEHLKNSGGQSHSKSNNRTKDQEHSSSFTSHPRETTPPRKKTKTKPEEYVVVKAEPDDDEDFALHMECIDEKESDNIVEIKDENNQRDLAAETQEDINFLLNVEGASASHQYNSGDRSWSQRLPTSTVTSQMDTNLSPMSGQGSQGFSNLNLLTHGVDIEDGTMRLTTRVQHPSFIPGQTDSNTPEQRTIPRPSGQDPASNTIGPFNDPDLDSLLDRTNGMERRSWTTEPRFKCDQCKYTTEHKYRIKRHQRIHKGDYFKCDQCSNKFTELCELRAHRQSRHEGIAVKCEMCGREFASKYALSHHRSSAHQSKIHFCNRCDKSFVTMGKLVIHLKSVHNVEMGQFAGLR